jgi:ribosomal protein S18 acetylase RimI-like enzyme
MQPELYRTRRPRNQLDFTFSTVGLPSLIRIRKQMTMSTTINIRTANTSDAEAIGEINVKGWRTGYKDILPQSHLDDLSINDRVARWQRTLSHPVETTNILVAEEHTSNVPHTTRVLGFISFGETMPSPSDEALIHDGTRTGELRAIYVDPQAWSSGVGQLLWKAAQQRLIDAGCTSVQVEMFARNERAIRFYRAAGFANDVAGLDEGGGLSVETVQMTKALV